MLLGFWVRESFRKQGVPCFGVLIMRILLFRVLYYGSPIFGNSHASYSAAPLSAGAELHASSSSKAVSSSVFEEGSGFYRGYFKGSIRVPACLSNCS